MSDATPRDSCHGCLSSDPANETMIELSDEPLDEEKEMDESTSDHGDLASLLNDGEVHTIKEIQQVIFISCLLDDDLIEYSFPFILR